MSRSEDSAFRHFVRQLEVAQHSHHKIITQKQTLGKSHHKVPPPFVVERRRYGSPKWEVHSSHYSLKEALRAATNTTTHEYRLKDDD